MSADVQAGEEPKLLAPSHGARRVGRYLLCDQIGSGGMATIHLARLIGPQGFSRTVAIKQLHPQFAQNPQFVAMLLDEARLAVRVRHVNVVSPLDIVTTDAELFIVMDYVNGESLANLLAASETPLSPAIAAAIMVQVLLGLHAAHEATREQGDALGLVHRDVSPQNILVGQDGVTRVVDFGIAKAVARAQTTDGGMVKGKLGYMAPEQIRLEAVDRRTDLFSAGVVLWEALTGAGLFVADALGASIDLILRGPISPPSRYNRAVTPELDAFVLKALTRDRDDRFQDAMSMAAALQRVTPLASALELIDWVAKLAGPELERRAGLVKRVEATSWESVPEVTPRPFAPPIEPRASSVRVGGSDQVGVTPQTRTPTLLGIAEPRERRTGSSPDSFAAGLMGGLGAGIAGNVTAPRRLDPAEPVISAAPVATGESTGIAVGGDRYSSVSSSGRSDRDRKTKGLVLGLVLAGVATAVGLLALSGADDAPSLAGAPERSSAARPVALEVVAAPLESASAAAPPAVAPASPSQRAGGAEPSNAAGAVRRVRDDVSRHEAGSASPDDDSAWGDPREPAVDERRAKDDAYSLRRARSARAGRSERASSSGRSSAASARRAAATRKVENKPNVSATPSEGVTLPKSSNDNCNPPWVINDQQVKVFKAECLR